MATTLTDTLGPRPASALPNFDMMIPAQRTLSGALKLALLLANTATAFANPTSFDASKTATYAVAPEGVSARVAALEIAPGDDLIAKVREIGMIEDGWFRPSSLAAPPAAVHDAEEFLRAIDWREVTRPVISLSEDGEINFLWRSEGLYLDLGFVGEGTYSFYGRAQDGEIFLGDDVPSTEPLPDALSSLMRSSSL